jgi:DNA-binding transcriptional regulator YiaG
MRNAKLKKQFTSVIALHYDRELWHSRPERSYEECIEPFVDELVQVATHHKSGKEYQPYLYDEVSLRVTTEMGETIGENIRELRAERGWSIDKFAEKTGINVNYLRCVERGEPILRMWALEVILEVLKVKSSAVLPF